MQFENITQQLQKYITFVKNAAVEVTIVEAVSVILMGTASGNVTSSNTFWIVLLVLFAGAYLSLLFLKTLYNKTFPGSIVEELKSERELTALKRNTISDLLYT